MTEHAFPCHERLRLQNFTAFSDTTFEFVPGINVLIGENGTGKTHVMKALYAWQMARHLAAQGQQGKYEQIFSSTYGATSVREMQRSKTKAAIASGTFGEQQWSVGLQDNNGVDNGIRPAATRPVFIPAIEMMAHSRNMNGILRDYADFDRTCFDFLAMVTATNLSPIDNMSIKEVDELRKLIPGEVEWNDQEERFYLVDKGGRLPFQLVAEGIRKVSALSRLISSQWIVPGTVLFWDEPEVNLNPKWMDSVIRALVALARAQVQVFIATHSYVILKEIDLVIRAQKSTQATSVSTRFFSLRRERNLSKVMWADTFSAAEPNAILDQYDKMMTEDWQLQDLEDRLSTHGAVG